MSATQKTDFKTPADRHDLPVELVHAIVITESAGVNISWRVEPPYRYLWDNRADRPFRHLTHAENTSEIAPSDFAAIGGQSRDTEFWGQQASWGLMQVMGAVARENGFTSAFPGLCDPSVGVEFGCRHLADLVKHYKHQYGWAGVVAAYNAGSPRRNSTGQWVNQRYVDTVARNGAAHLIRGTS